MSYKTPGVYVKEESLLAPSVAGVSTAVPAFIGYTEKAPEDLNGDVITSPIRIKTLLDYEEKFGGAPRIAITAKDNGDGTVGATIGDLNYLMHYSLSLYFKNGGGPCYIVSAGQYGSDLLADTNKPAKQNLSDSLTELKAMDEPTLIVLTDAVALEANDYYGLCVDALAQCGKLMDRFAIIDVKPGATAIADLRDKIGQQNLSYGAAYYPYIQTNLNYYYEEGDVTLAGDNWVDAVGELTAQGLKVSYAGASADSPTFEIAVDGSATEFTIADKALKLSVDTSDTLADIMTAWTAFGSKGDFNIEQIGLDDDVVNAAMAETGLAYDAAVKLSDAAVKEAKSELYNKIKTEIAKYRVTLPPSAAIAGVYAAVDASRGVWKAPANYSLAGVSGPVATISDDDQESMNVHETGKSINAIRYFAGKGILVWGARTLDGNSNEWRYIPVRRLYNYVEESVKKATAFAVFEPNVPMTWLKIKTMISNFLEGIWKDGGLAGVSKDQAFFVNVGLGETMTEQDVLEGRMIVKIGMAAVRPAEFIILKFSHKLQNS